MKRTISTDHEQKANNTLLVIQKPYPAPKNLGSDNFLIHLLAILFLIKKLTLSWRFPKIFILMPCRMLKKPMIHHQTLLPNCGPPPKHNDKWTED